MSLLVLCGIGFSAHRVCPSQQKMAGSHWRIATQQEAAPSVTATGRDGDE